MLWILFLQKGGDHLQGPPTLQFNVYKRLFPWGGEVVSVTLITLLHLLLRLRMNGTIPLLPCMPSQCTQRNLSFSYHLNIYRLFRVEGDDRYMACLTLILRRSRTGTVWFYTSTSKKRAAQPKLYTKSLTRDLKRMYSHLTLVRISINL